ncbi:MAG: hypothetical protein FWG11_04120, partial [Promicromonosporaceae bacterium]|nr:hypothetical protein [Promicromonosporaceae bacterium]
MLTKTTQWRRLGALGLAVPLLAAGMLAPLGAAATAVADAQAEGSAEIVASSGNAALVDVELILYQTGTGHAGAAHGPGNMRTFVNSANGFAVGDNSATDGVVGSFDLVAYRLELEFHSGPAREVVVTIDVPAYLQWPPGAATCPAGSGLTPVRVGNQCIYQVPGEMVVSVQGSIIMTARDTGGHVRPGQVTTVSAATLGATPELAAAAAPVTVVSAPAVDLIVLQPNHITWEEGRTNIYRSGSHATQGTWHATNPIGSRFRVQPVPLGMAGYHATNGVSTSGPWSGYLDVSAFPRSTWTIGGATVTPVGPGCALPAPAGVPLNGPPPTVMPEAARCLLPLGSNSGHLDIHFMFNEAPPFQAPGTVFDYPVRIVVDPGSFSVDPQMLNNGTDTQPGDGQDAAYPTRHDPTRAMRGEPWPNNDWTAFRVRRVPESGLGAMTKQIRGPLDPDQSVWHPANVLASVGEDRSRHCDSTDWANWRITHDRCYVAPATELTVRLINDTRTATIDTSLGRVVMADHWDHTQQRIDTTRAPRVILRGQPVDPSLYVIEYTDSLPWGVPGVVAGIALDGSVTWSATPGPDTNAFRVVFGLGAIPHGSDPGAGDLIVYMPFIVDEDIAISNGQVDPELHGTFIPNRAVHKIHQFEADGVTLAHTEYRTEHRWVVLAVQSPLSSITNNVVDVGGTPNTENPPTMTVLPGQTLTYEVVPSISGFDHIPDYVTPVVYVTLDRCVENPVNTSPGWIMEIVTPAVPGPVSGRVCGDPDSTPAVLRFVPVGGTAEIVDDSAWWGGGDLAPITYTVTVVYTAHANSSIHNDAEVIMVEAPNRPSDAVAIYVRPQASGTARIEAISVPCGEDLTFSATVNTTSAVAWTTDTVIVLPRPGDGQFLHASAVANGYTGPQESVLSGGYVVTGLGLDLENTSEGARLYFTTNPEATFAQTASTWYPVTAGADFSAATAVRLVVDVTAGNFAPARVNISLRTEFENSADAYVMWMGRTTTGGVAVSYPWPAHASPVACPVDSGFGPMVVAGAYAIDHTWDLTKVMLDTDGEVKDDGLEIAKHPGDVITLDFQIDVTAAREVGDVTKTGSLRLVAGDAVGPLDLADLTIAAGSIPVTVSWPAGASPLLPGEHAYVTFTATLPRADLPAGGVAFTASHPEIEEGRTAHLAVADLGRTVHNSHARLTDSFPEFAAEFGDVLLYAGDVIAAGGVSFAYSADRSLDEYGSRLEVENLALLTKVPNPECPDGTDCTDSGEEIEDDTSISLVTPDRIEPEPPTP